MSHVCEEMLKSRFHLSAWVEREEGRPRLSWKSHAGGAVGYCVSVRVCERTCACLCACVCACEYVCKGGAVILSVTQRTQSLPAPPASLTASFHYLTEDPRQTGSQVQS